MADETKDVMSELAGICLQYTTGEMKPLIFDSFVSSYASCFAEPYLSQVLKRVERTVGEHRCYFWNACRDACAFEGNESYWAENIRNVSPLFTTIESEANN